MALPDLVHDRKELLTLDTKELPIYVDALMPGASRPETR